MAILRPSGQRNPLNDVPGRVFSVMFVISSLSYQVLNSLGHSRLGTRASTSLPPPESMCTAIILDDEIALQARGLFPSNDRDGNPNKSMRAVLILQRLSTASRPRHPQAARTKTDFLPGS